MKKATTKASISMLQVLKTFVFFQRSKKWGYTTLILSIVLGVLSPLTNGVITPYFYARFIDKLQHDVTQHVLSWQNAVATGVIAFVVMTFIWHIVHALRDYVITILESKTIQKMDNFTSAHLIKLSLDFFKDNHTGALVSKQTRFSANYERMFDTIYFDVLQTTVLLVFSIPIIFMYSWILGSILLSFAGIYIFLSYIFSEKVRDDQEKMSRARTKQTGLISDQIANIQTVKFFGRDEYEVANYEKQNEKLTSFRLTLWMKDYWFRQIKNTFKILMDVSMLIMCYVLWTKGSLSISSIILIMTYHKSISDRLWSVEQVIKTFRVIQADTTEMVEILNVKPAVVDVADPLPCDIRAGHIKFNDVTFHYAGNAANVFTNFSLEIQPGEKVGIVGTSGSGKTTLMQLLMRMMDIQSGEILIDGTPIHLVRQQELRGSMSIVPQETILFHRTVRDNIAYDRPDATDEEIMEAAKKAQAHTFIEALANRNKTAYHVKVGERGIKLSGGQRQRVGLARAFLQHKPILILDEATSSLDSVSEKEIQQALENLLHEDATMLIIAHRLSTVHNLDRIIVMENGQIVQDGNPNDLYNIEGGAYRTLVDAQTLELH